MNFIVLIYLSFISYNTLEVASSQNIASPDSTIKVSVEVDSFGLEYAIDVDGTTIIKPSKLGLVLGKTDTLGQRVKLLSVDKNFYDSTWINPFGKSRKVQNYYNELHLHFQELAGNSLNFEVIFRVYNNGVAFRYVLPDQPDLKSFTVTKELSAFTFSKNYQCYLGHNPDYHFKGPQEWNYESAHLGDMIPDSAYGDPLLIHTPAAWIALTEADLEDWAGMWISRSKGSISATKAQDVTLISRLAPRPDGKGLVIGETPKKSPWRVLMIGRNPGSLVTSNIILNLNPSSQLSDTSWIRPGIMAWDHWWSGGVKMNTATIKEYIQLASTMGWPYQLIDWQWYGSYNTPKSDITTPASNVDIVELLRFAKKKHVNLWVWLHWKDLQRNDAYKKAFALYEKWGVAGIKIDFMDRDDQYMVNWYHKIIKAAAAHHLLVNFHGAYNPTGIRRSYPNLMTREGLLANEYNRWSRRVTSKHKLMLPFTRLLTGPADFTPGGFMNRQPSKFEPDSLNAEVQGTRSSELALFVIYNSPIQVAADSPSHYKNEPGIKFLKIVPTVWDEARVLKADVGKYIVVARRKGNQWFIGAMTDNTDRSFTIPLDFLGRGDYKIQTWQDAEDSNIHAQHLNKYKKRISSKSKINIRMVRNGGYVARIVKESK